MDGTLLWAPTFGSEKKTKPFLHLSLGKAGAFTVESHICVKALKCKVSQIIRCLIKPLLKNSTQTIFQGDTSWLAQLLNNIIVWMVLYCEHQLLGVKKKQNPFSTFLWVKLAPFTFCVTLESHNHNWLSVWMVLKQNPLKCKVLC